MSPRPRLRTLTASLALALAATAGTGLTAHADEHAVPGTAGATTLTDVVEAPRPAFYEPPAQVPTTPGTVIRQEKADNVLDPLDAASLTFDTRRVMYSSTDREGTPIAVTGVVATPKAPWRGTGPRPVIAFAAGTQGMGDSCAPSRSLQRMGEYEVAFFTGLLAKGYTVALTDYQGLGTPGTHTYMVREAQAHAVLDMARAAARLGIPGITTANPVGLTGYSQGGGAAAAAAELAATYAPDVPVRGTAAGAVPADLSVGVPQSVDGSLLAVLELYATTGLFASHHVDPSAFFTARGIDTLKKVESSCVLGLFDYSFSRTSTLTKDGRPLHESFAREPLATMLRENRIGSAAPTGPVLLTHSRGDDAIPYSQGLTLAKDWCAKGAHVAFQPLVVPTHLGGIFGHSLYTLTFFDQVFTGKATANSCPGL